MIGEKVVAAVDPPDYGADLPLVATYERPHVVTEFPIPLKPGYAREASAQLIAREIPGFGNEPDAGESRVRCNLRYYRWIV